MRIEFKQILTGELAKFFERGDAFLVFILATPDR
jgi:hypothetical protein